MALLLNAWSLFFVFFHQLSYIANLGIYNTKSGKRGFARRETSNFTFSQWEYWSSRNLYHFVAFAYGDRSLYGIHYETKCDSLAPWETLLPILSKRLFTRRTFDPISRLRLQRRDKCYAEKKQALYYAIFERDRLAFTVLFRIGHVSYEHLRYCGLDDSRIKSLIRDGHYEKVVYKYHGEIKESYKLSKLGRAMGCRLWGLKKPYHAQKPTHDIAIADRYFSISEECRDQWAT